MERNGQRSVNDLRSALERLALRSEELRKAKELRFPRGAVVARYPQGSHGELGMNSAWGWGYGHYLVNFSWSILLILIVYPFGDPTWLECGPFPII